MTQRIENGVVVGTSGDKFKTKNPLAKYLLSQFDRTVSELAGQVAPERILEVGCGEGHVLKLLHDATSASIYAVDLSQRVLEEARQAVPSDRVQFHAVDMLDLRPVEPAPDLVVCCEVLEHLPNPRLGLEALSGHKASWYLLSVPREPIWRVLNTLRGAHLKDLGNSPGHLQHWSRRSFLDFIRPVFEPVVVRAPLPWTVVLCRRHDRSA